MAKVETMFTLRHAYGTLMRVFLCVYKGVFMCIYRFHTSAQG